MRPIRIPHKHAFEQRSSVLVFAEGLVDLDQHESRIVLGGVGRQRRDQMLAGGFEFLALQADLRRREMETGDELVQDQRPCPWLLGDQLGGVEPAGIAAASGSLRRR